MIKPKPWTSYKCCSEKELEFFLKSCTVHTIMNFGNGMDYMIRESNICFDFDGRGEYDGYCHEDWSRMNQPQFNIVSVRSLMLPLFVEVRDDI